MNRFILETIAILIATTLASIAGTYTTALSLTAMLPAAVFLVAVNTVLTFTLRK